MADTTIDLLKNSSYIGKMDELIAAVKSGGGTASDVEWDNVKNKPTTIVGYGITDAKIDNGTITLGANTITPLTSAPVTSVNSKTGDVVLNASDVGAISTSDMSQTLGVSTTKVPSEKAVSDALSAAGAGDMLKSVYDSDNSVANSGGIAQYVATNSPVISVNGESGAVQIDSLPNPEPLSFTGAITGTYDGSEGLSIEIPKDNTFVCTITGSGTTTSPYVCDKTTVQIYAALQAGKIVIAKYIASMYNLLGAQGPQLAVFGGLLPNNNIRHIKVDANKTVTIEDYQSLVPEAKTDAMTQAVGKDADGKLWTAPGGGGGSSGIELVYTWTADGTTMSAINDLTIEPGKLYFCETIVPSNGDLTANVTTPVVTVYVGTAGNTYTGMRVAQVAGQQKYGATQSRWTFFVLGGTLHSVSDRTQSSQNVPQNAAYAANKVYISSQTSGVNIISGTTVNIYKMG